MGYFGDYKVCLDNQIAKVMAKGLRLINRELIDFKTCVELYKMEHPDEKRKVIGERWKNDNDIMLYTYPSATMIAFLDDEENKRLDEFSKKIEAYGYIFCDMK